MKNILIKMFGRVSRRAALRIATKACASTKGNLSCHSQKPVGLNLYNGPPDDMPCWWISIFSGDHVGEGRIMAISKRTGEILYDGSDGME